MLTERAFSIVRKHKTVFRLTLSTRVLNALLTQKISMSAYGQVCYKLQYSKDILRKAKQATAAKQTISKVYVFIICVLHALLLTDAVIHVAYY